MELQIIQSKIFEIRGCRVMLDKDLAILYQVDTKVLKQAVKRNLDRFPPDFMFELTKEEDDSLRSQFVTLNEDSSKRGKHSKYLSYVFMLAHNPNYQQPKDNIIFRLLVILFYP